MTVVCIGHNVATKLVWRRRYVRFLSESRARQDKGSYPCRESMTLAPYFLMPFQAMSKSFSDRFSNRWSLVLHRCRHQSQTRPFVHCPMRKGSVDARMKKIPLAFALSNRHCDRNGVHNAICCSCRFHDRKFVSYSLSCFGFGRHSMLFSSRCDGTSSSAVWGDGGITFLCAGAPLHPSSSSWRW